MDSPRPSSPPIVIVPCNAGCRYAESMRGEYADWIWCTRPAALNRTKSAGTDCRWFLPRTGFDRDAAG